MFVPVDSRPMGFQEFCFAFLGYWVAFWLFLGEMQN
jgi:hypothetical protein